MYLLSSQSKKIDNTKALTKPSSYHTRKCQNQKQFKMFCICLTPTINLIGQIQLQCSLPVHYAK